MSDQSDVKKPKRTIEELEEMMEEGPIQLLPDGNVERLPTKPKVEALEGLLVEEAQEEINLLRARLAEYENNPLLKVTVAKDGTQTIEIVECASCKKGQEEKKIAEQKFEATLGVLKEMQEVFGPRARYPDGFAYRLQERKIISLS